MFRCAAQNRSEARAPSSELSQLNLSKVVQMMRISYWCTGAVIMTFASDALTANGVHVSSEDLTPPVPDTTNPGLEQPPKKPEGPLSSNTVPDNMKLQTPAEEKEVNAAAAVNKAIAAVKKPDADPSTDPTPATKGDINKIKAQIKTMNE